MSVAEFYTALGTHTLDYCERIYADTRTAKLVTAALKSLFYRYGTAADRSPRLRRYIEEPVKRAAALSISE